MSRRLIKISLSAMTAVLLAVGGVSAAWTYAEGKINDLQITPVIEMGIFNWEGAEILPDDVLGENHQALIDELLNDSEHGMNAEDSELNTQINNRVGFFNKDTFGNMDFWDSDDMEQLFGLDASNLSFMVHFPDDTKNIRYIYTTSVDLGAQRSPNIPVGENIYAVYRTTLVRQDENSDWVAQKSETGYAKSAYYDNSITGTLLRQPAFDVESWTAGELGKGFDDAIYAFIGETDSAYVSSETQAAYYKIVVQSAQTITVSSTNEHVTVTVYDESKNALKKQSGEANNSFSWEATAQTYYFSLVGDTSMNFSVTAT